MSETRILYSFVIIFHFILKKLKKNEEFYEKYKSEPQRIDMLEFSSK